MPKRTAPPTTRVEDLAGPMPVEVLRGWVEGTRSVTRAWEYLKQYLDEGTVLAGDGWRMTARSLATDPVELAAQVNRSKRIVYALVAAAGGRAPGAPWRADNFEVFFPARAPVEFALGVALEAHKRIAAAGAVPLCACLHRGHFYELGGGLYGDDANLVEFLAEEAAHGGETLATRAVIDGLRRATKLASARRTDLDHMQVEIHRIAPDASVPVPLAMASATGTYPLPYPEAFYRELCVVDDAARWPAVRAELSARYLGERSVVMAELCEPTPSRPYDILEGAIKDGEVALAVTRLLPDGGHLIENARGAVLASFDDPQAAVDFAWGLGRALFDVDRQVQIGVDRGPALLVPGTGDEPTALIGAPVPVASKLCHEMGEPNLLHVSERALAGVKLPAEGKPFTRRVSDVPLAGLVLDVAG
jgi:class 3 adenylate cyclase